MKKPKFRDYAGSLEKGEKEILVRGLEDFLYNDQESGFSAMVDILGPGKIAKWPVINSNTRIPQSRMGNFCKTDNSKKCTFIF